MAPAQRPTPMSKQKGMEPSMKFFTEPEIDIQKFAVKDIITSSDLGGDELPPVGGGVLGISELPPA